MDIKGEFQIPAPREAVWRDLNDPEVLRHCIPGCKEIEKTSATEFTARVVLRVGPVKAPFRGKVTLSDLDPPNGYTITGEGQGGVAGFARGQATVRLAGNGATTVLTYQAAATVGGKLAQVGQRLLDTTARKFADDFFKKFTEQISASAGDAVQTEPESPAAAGGEPEPAREGVSPWVWVSGIILATIALLAAFQF
jgi:hypothetical protein